MNDRWISVHLFYSGDLTLVLTECIAPLVDRMRADGLIVRYFFVRYWLGGPHVRLRLLPRDGVSPDQVRSVVDPALEAFLTRWPSLYEFDPDAQHRISREMFEAEYGADELRRQYGDHGPTPLYPTNSFQYLDYEPELVRYGGGRGLSVAERHFETSSDVVLEVIRSTNVQVRTILLGQGFRVMSLFAYGFFREEEEVSRFLAHYMGHWRRGGDGGEGFRAGLEKQYQRSAESIAARLAATKEVSGSAGSRRAGDGIDHGWAAHARALGEELRALFRSNGLEMPEGCRTEEAALQYLLTSYLHMTNNRLGLRLVDEVYLSYLTRRAIEDARSAGRFSGRP